MTPKPIIAINATTKHYHGIPYHTASDLFIKAVLDFGAIPFIIPSIKKDALVLLEIADGLLLTGSHQHINPETYGQKRVFPVDKLDIARDQTNLSLIPEAISKKIPILAVCRGMQEMNISFGGTLHQKLQDLPSNIDHREKGDTLDEKFQKQHTVDIIPHGILDSILDKKTYDINSLHEQGIDQLGKNIRAEARAPDGTIEAISIDQDGYFAFGTQWHPEWDIHQDSLSMALWQCFISHVEQYQKSRA